MNSYASGKVAEDYAADCLTAKGYKIISRNWRTPYCEIDIIALTGERLLFVEVKYRSTSSAGSAIDAITPAKLRQMTYAAQLWLARHNWQGDCQLAVLTIDADRTKLLYIN